MRSRARRGREGELIALAQEIARADASVFGAVIAAAFQSERAAW